METSSILSIDIGTSSLKAAVINKKGKVLSYARIPFIKRFGDSAALEWLESTEDAIQILETNLKKSGQELQTVKALCISGNGPTIVSNEGYTLLWNEDTDRDIEEKIKALKIRSLYIPRLLQFRKKFQNIYSEFKTIFSGPEFLIYQLTGKKLTILPEERFRQAYWTMEELEKAGFSKEEMDMLPNFSSPGEKAGAISSTCHLKIHSKLIMAGVPVFCGAPDFVSALVGTATLKAGRLCDRAGSSEGINLCTTKPISGKNIRTLPSIIPGLWNASVLFPASGEKFWAFKNKIERETGKNYTFKELVTALIESDGSNASFDQGKYLMIQTAMEVRDGIRNLLDTAEKENAIPQKPDTMTVTGGQAANYDWNKMKADITGMKIKVLSCSDSELLGDAVFAFTGLGEFDSIQEGAENILTDENI